MDCLKQIIDEVKAKAREGFVPIVRDNTLKALLELTRNLKPKNILEIGTATGYSALNMLSNCEAHLLTIEKNAERVAEARLNFEKSKQLDRITLIEGDAIDVLSDLVQSSQKFDLIFLDGPKGQYIKYLPFLKQLLNEGGVIFADNVGLLGLVANQEKVNHKNRTMVRNMQSFLNEIQTDSDFNSNIYDIDDGYAVIQKIQKNDRNN